MADGKRIIRRRIPCAEARTAERGFHDAACLHQRGRSAVFGNCQADGRGRRIHAHIKITVADTLPLQNCGGLHDILKHTAGTAHNDPLVAGNFAVHNIFPQVHCHFAAQLLVARGLDLCENLLRIFLQLMDGVGDGGMEGQGDHALHFAQVDFYHSVIIRAVFRMQLPEILRTANVLIVRPNRLVRLPD